MKYILVVAGFLLLIGGGCTTSQIRTQSASSCDVGNLCLQESENEGGVYGVATVDAHYLGRQTFTDISGDIVTCPIMAIGSANDDRVLEEFGVNPNGESVLVIPDDQIVRFQGTTANAPVQLKIYIEERKGSGSGPCDIRAHIVN